MLWMKTFCFSCSVRLGVICSAIMSIIEVFIPLLAFLIIGTPIFKNVANILESDEEYNQQYYIRKILDTSKKEPQKFLLIIEIYLSIHILCCIFAIFGAIRLNKWLLVPYIVMEFIRFIITLTTHIIGMIILKKLINLGLLIAATIAGGFFILSIAYMWSGGVGLFQIIGFINTDKYKKLYGDDPLSPNDNEINNNHSVENIKIFSTPNYDDVDAQKMGYYSNSINGVRKKLNKNNYNKSYPKDIAINDNYGENVNIDYGKYWHVNEIVQKKRWHNNNYNPNIVSYF